MDAIWIAWAPAFILGVPLGYLLAVHGHKPPRSTQGYVLSAYLVVSVGAGAAFSMWWAPLVFKSEWGGQPDFFPELSIALISAVLRLMVGFILSFLVCEGMHEAFCPRRRSSPPIP